MHFSMDVGQKKAFIIYAPLIQTYKIIINTVFKKYRVSERINRKNKVCDPSVK